MLIAERYRLGPSLGRGGMGEVFRATDEVLGRPVAVKLLLRTDSEPAAAERFHREARAAAGLSDPHVVAVYDFGPHGDGFYLVMELVEGRSVADELAQRGPLLPQEALDIVQQSAAGLAAAHRENVVHRDIKPGNLLLTTDGTVKVADFGIAHLPGNDTTTLTSAGQILGTVHYLSPERAKGLPAGKAADVYALGCVLYQLVTGQPPFTAEHPTAILYQHVDTAPTPPSQLNPDLAGPYEGLMLRMLAKDPAVRPTADEIASGSLHDQLLSADNFSTTAQQDATPQQDERRRSFGRKHLVIAAAALLAAAGAITAAALLNGNAERPPTVEIGPPPSPKRGTPTTPATSPTTVPTNSDAVGQAARTSPTQRTSNTPEPSTPTPPPSATPSASPTTVPSSPSRSTPTPTPSPTRSTTTDTPTPTASDTPTAASPSPVNSTPASGGN